VDAGTLLSGMPGIAASAGAACHAENPEISHVLKAIGLEEEIAMGCIRFSTGKMTTLNEVAEAARIIVQTARPLMTNAGGAKTAEPGKAGIRLTSFTHGLGCACKLRPQDLEAVLKKMPVPEHESVLVDARDSDDASVWRIDADTAWVQSVDFFTPVVDDPYDFGRIAAANALSDLYAMGATPLFALNIVAFPVKRLPLTVLDTILQGALTVADEAGIHILGGHTIEDNELKYGMVVNGTVHPEKILRNSGSVPGDAIILTKPIGTGILSTALKRGRLQKEWEAALVGSMASLNRIPARILPAYPVHAVTDVTGFGLLGHLLEMARAGNVSAVVYQKKVPVLKGVRESIRTGMIPGGSMQNLEFVEEYTGWEGDDLTQDGKMILADAQTSGGLLIALPGQDASGLLEKIRKAGCPRAEIIGKIIEPSDRHLYIH
jgi:selenium donor protein